MSNDPFNIGKEIEEFPPLPTEPIEYVPTIHYVNNLLPTDSPALAAFLTKHVKGSRFGVAREGEQEWIVEEVEVNPDVPPDPMLGPVTMVSLAIGHPEDVTPP